MLFGLLKLLIYSWAVLPLGLYASTVEVDETGSAVVWATSVHDRLLEEAFPNEDRVCRIQMKLGSIHADTFHFQGEAFTYMHAMRSSEETPQEAEAKMWKHIRKAYGEAREAMKKYKQDHRRIDKKLSACFKRGFALHSVMDSTSPSHTGFKAWNPCDILVAIFDHGNVRENVEDLLGVGMGFPHSHEDMNALNQNDHLRRDTIQMLRTVDSALLKGDKYFKLSKKKISVAPKENK